MDDDGQFFITEHNKQIGEGRGLHKIKEVHSQASNEERQRKIQINREIQDEELNTEQVQMFEDIDNGAQNMADFKELA